MARLPRLSDCVVAAGFAVVAFFLSPFGIEWATGRPDLSFRTGWVSLVFAVFFAVVAVAVLAQGRLRRVLLYVLALVFPIVLLAAIEAGAIALDLADRVAPLEDTSILADKRPWPRQLLSDQNSYVTPQGFRLLRPWQGDGIVFNALGLRTAMPSPKAAGEWRIAITGGSAAWGWNVRDAATIAVQLQDILRHEGRANVTVYNFGIGGATLKQELALLKHFRDIYKIDQVVFFTGGNDVYYAYLTRPESGVNLGGPGTFETFKTLARLQAMWSDPSQQQLKRIDTQLLPAALKKNTLRVGILAANVYCRSADLRCDFVLQPELSERKPQVATEIAMAKTLARVYPRLDVLTRRMYADAISAGPAGHVFDLTHIFDGMTAPYFLDSVHLNEAGYRVVAEHIAPIARARLPMPSGAPGR